MSGTAVRAQRLARLRAAMTQAGIAATALAPTDNLRWLLGFTPLYDERLCALLVGADDGREAMAMPALNAEQTAAHVPELPLRCWADEDGPTAALTEALAAVLGDGGSGALSGGAGTRDGGTGARDGGTGARDGGTGALAVDPEMRADHLLALQALAGTRATVDAADVVGPLRERKDAGELDLLRRSSEVADLAMRAAFDAIAVGVSEQDIAEVICGVFRAHGCEPEFAIVAAGADGAFPHHDSGSAVLRDGDPVVIDIGAVRDGYHSDITRMAFLGTPGDRYREVHAGVEAAVVAACAAVRPGASCGEVDAAARGVISDAGFGAFFVHRTGHGLGLSGHEPPYIMDGSDVVLREGMVFSIEPGIYLPGEFGVRLEEIVHVTADGCERFSTLPRDVHVVA